MNATMMANSIDINADMGEYQNADERRAEAALMPFISSCSIACGGHTGDAESMGVTVRLARAFDVSIGAHPSYPDRAGFGRRPMEIDFASLRQSLTEQLDGLKDIAAAAGATLAHVKPHGALYHAATDDVSLARLIAETANGTMLMGPPGSALERAAEEAGLRFAAEGFVDRRYQASGALVPRNQPGAMIDSIAERAQQAVALATGAPIHTSGGARRLGVQTLCIHSDSPGAADTAKAVQAALQSNHIHMQALAL